MNDSLGWWGEKLQLHTLSEPGPVQHGPLCGITALPMVAGMILLLPKLLVGERHGVDWGLTIPYSREGHSNQGLFRPKVPCNWFLKHNQAVS